MKSPAGMVLFFLLLAASAHARTWEITVDGLGDAPTIQAGIDSAAAGDTVLVGAGRYYENINFKGKAIVVRGEDRNTTIIDGSSTAESCVLFVSGEERDSILEGFTLTGGSGHATQAGGTHWGGGVFALNSSPTMRGNTITGNKAVTGYGYGGGIYCDTGVILDPGPLVEGNIISNNVADVNGGGIAILGATNPFIINNYLDGNSTSDGDGGALFLFVSVDGGRIYGNTIVNNTAADHGGGLFIAPFDSQHLNVVIEVGGNLIASNLAIGGRVTSTGGGIWVIRMGAWIHHNTIVGNEGRGPNAYWGGGVGIVDSPELVLEQNIIALTVGGGGVRCDYGPAVIRNNLAWANAGGDGVADCADWTLGNGNLVADPYFCNAVGGDYTVAANSPALTHPAGPLGAFAVAGCGPVDIRPITWGQLKSRYH